MVRTGRGTGARLRAGAVVGVLVLALTACQTGREGADVPDGTPGGTDGTGEPGDPRDEPATWEGAELVLEGRTGGGFVPWGYDARQVPSLSVYRDAEPAGGRAIVTGPTTLQYPGAALPNLLQVRLDDDVVAGLVDAAEEAGLLGPAPDYGRPNVADLPTTTVTLRVAGEEYVHEAYALDVAPPEPVGDDGALPGWDDGLTDDQRAARAALTGFLRQATEATSGSGGAQPYEPTALAVLAMPAGEWTGEAELTPDVVPWPLSVSLAEGGCRVVAGDDAATLLATLASATELTRFEQDGVAYEVAARPLLPHESTCADAGIQG